VVSTNVYVDGFNFYYRCVRGTPYKWLDFSKLCPLLIPGGHQVQRVKYFTARVKPLPRDPDAPSRQQAYLRALGTIPNLSIIYGHFRKNVVRMPLAKPVPGGPRTVEVIKTEEKGSDVNLASHLLLDTFRKDCQAALVISNDTDLLEPIRIVRMEFHCKIGLAYPPAQVPHALLREVDFVRQIRESGLRKSQFPLTLTDLHGTISKPASW